MSSHVQIIVSNQPLFLKSTDEKQIPLPPPPQFFQKESIKPAVYEIIETEKKNLLA